MQIPRKYWQKSLLYWLRETDPNYLRGLLFMSLRRNYYSSGGLKKKEEKGEGSLHQGPELTHSSGQREGKD